MKVCVAVVSSVTDYRKEQSVCIDHTSVHVSCKEAARAVLKALVEQQPDFLCSCDVDLEAILGSQLTKAHINRLSEHMRSKEIEAGWEEDDVPSDNEGAFEKFQETELAKIKENAQKIRDFVRKGDKNIPFISNAIPELPNGEYVWEPIVWTIKETELDLPVPPCDRKEESRSEESRP